MKTAIQLIEEALTSFFETSSGEQVETLERMMSEWYQHYARDQYDSTAINEMVNGVFRISDLILRLNDAMVTLKEEQGIKTDHLPSDHYDYRYAS